MGAQPPGMDYERAHEGHAHARPGRAASLRTKASVLRFYAAAMGALGALVAWLGGALWLGGGLWSQLFGAFFLSSAVALVGGAWFAARASRELLAGEG